MRQGSASLPRAEKAILLPSHEDAGRRTSMPAASPHVGRTLEPPWTERLPAASREAGARTGKGPGGEGSRSRGGYFPRASGLLPYTNALSGGLGFLCRSRLALFRS